MKRENLIESMQKHSFSIFSKEWYEKVADNVLLDLEGKTSKGYIYFIRYGSHNSSNPVKIGFASNIINRVKSFQTSSYDDVFLIGFIYTDNYQKLEREFHSKLKDCKLNGEWFSLSLNSCVDLIYDYQGTIVNTRVDKKMIIEDGIVISTSNIKLNIVCEDKVLYSVFNKIQRGLKLHINSVYDLMSNNDSNTFSKKKITTNLRKYASETGIKYFSGNSNGQRWFMLE